MWNLLQIELFKISKRPRTYIAFAAIAAIVLIFQFAFKADGESYMNLMMQNIQDNFELDKSKAINGYFMCYIILNTLLIQVPILVALIAGDAISGEANMGTLRLLITKPISRDKLITAKFLASAIYTLLLLIWMAIWALFGSMLIFGTDDLIILKSDTVIQILASDTFWRYFAAFGFAALAMVTVSALSFFLSIFAENSIGPIIACMSIVIIFTILNTLNLPIFNVVKPYLFTSHMLGWKGFFDIKVDINNEQIPGSIENLPAVLKSALILFFHIIGFWLASIWVFRKKDIMS